MKESRGTKMTAGTVQKGPSMWGGLMVLVVFLGLCTMFASVVTVAQAWQEHVQARWPEVTARVDECALRRISTGRRNKFYLRCRFSYAVGAEQHATHFYSRSVPSPETWQYPPNQIAPFEKWVGEHPRGTPMEVRYDPGDHTKVALATPSMVFGVPRTPSNVKLLEVCAGSFAVLLTIALITRQRFLCMNDSSVPLKS